MTPKHNALEGFLSEMSRIRATGAGVEETSYYPALANALNEIGRGLRPKVHCVLQLANRGAGVPDGGLFTAEQCRARDLSEPLLGQVPARGVIEIKGPGHDLKKLIESDQVARYWEKYRLVLVTNYRAMALIGGGPDGKPRVLERFVLAENEAGFWKLAQHPRTAQEKLGAPFAEYLHRVLLHNAPLASPRDVASILASYARDALARIENAEMPALVSLRAALSEALGLRFEGEKGEHFFRSTLVQTLFYGLFAAWVLWSRSGRSSTQVSFPEHIRESASPLGPRPERFEWRTAEWSLRLPVIRVLFEQVATPSKLGPLDLVEVLDWAAAALGRVDEAAFFKSFDEGHAVQYFYEPFLEAFDPVLRKDLGVWYTPEEIVAYQVARVDAVLREELNIPDGLADPKVYVLDPCCGTGAYLRFVLAKIEETLRAKGDDALVANDLKRAAIDRVFGFEILPAPFVIAHLQLGLLLQKLGAPLSERKSERVGIYLTNALVGWEPPTGPKQSLIWPEMEEERDAADRVKRETPILVVLGNPPYNGYAGVAVDEERGLSTTYRTVKRVAAPQGQGLNDLFVRFFRMAEHRIVEHTGRGVVCFISNYSWLDGLSFTGMRERFLEVFDDITVDCLNGDKYKTGKLTPEGKPDPSVFSTEHNREGIQVGTAITTLVKKAPDERGPKGAEPLPATLRLRHLWGTSKREELLATKEQTVEERDRLYAQVLPSAALGLSFLSLSAQTDYFTWPRLTALFPQSFPGVKTSRDDFLVDIDRDHLETRLRTYFDLAVSNEEMARLAPSAMQRTARFDPYIIRDQLRRRGIRAEGFVRYAYRPFDLRWLYWERDTKLLDEKRPEYFQHVAGGNFWLEARQRQAKEAFDRGFVVRALADNFGSGLSSFFPMYLKAEGAQPLFASGAGWIPNLSSAAAEYIGDCGGDISDLFNHAVATVHSPAYREQNASALRQDWPRVPLPAQRDVFAASAELGKKVTALLDIDSPVQGVTTGIIDPAYRSLGVLHRVADVSIDLEAGDLDVTCGWGHAGKGGVVMPGRGRTTDHGDALDIWLNDRVYWRNVPRSVWEYTIGGYQVIKKWLSYREKALLGRALTPEEARYVTEMVRRMAALTAMRPELDANYEAVRADTVPLPGSL